MSNSPIATKEDARYFTPRALNRIPVSEYDWERLKAIAAQRPEGKNWPSFIRSLSLGVLVSSLFNLIQLAVLVPEGGYPVWVWVLGFGLLIGSAVAAVFAQALTSAHSQIVAEPLLAIESELQRIEETFEPYSESSSANSASAAAAKRDWVARRRREMSEQERSRGNEPTAEPPPDDTLPESREAAARQYRTDFKPGDLVRHRGFGDGRVVNRVGDQLEIVFRNGQTKRLLAGYAPLALIGREE